MMASCPVMARATPPESGLTTATSSPFTVVAGRASADETILRAAITLDVGVGDGRQDALLQHHFHILLLKAGKLGEDLDVRVVEVTSGAKPSLVRDGC